MRGTNTASASALALTSLTVSNCEAVPLVKHSKIFQGRFGWLFSYSRLQPYDFCRTITVFSAISLRTGPAKCQNCPKGRNIGRASEVSLRMAADVRFQMLRHVSLSSFPRWVLVFYRSRWLKRCVVYDDVLGIYTRFFWEKEISLLARLSLCRSTCRCASLVQSPVCCPSDFWPCAPGSFWWRQTAAANSPKLWLVLGCWSKLDPISLRSWTMKEITIQDPKLT